MGYGNLEALALLLLDSRQLLPLLKHLFFSPHRHSESIPRPRPRRRLTNVIRSVRIGSKLACQHSIAQATADEPRAEEGCEGMHLRCLSASIR